MLAGHNAAFDCIRNGAIKASVHSFASTWCAELQERNVPVNAISPGVIPTPGYYTSLAMMQEQVDEWVQNAIGIVPPAARALTDEIAKGFLFSASEESS